MHCTTNHTHTVRQQRRKELLEGADIDSAHTNETVILVSATTNKQKNPAKCIDFHLQDYYG